MNGKKKVVALAFSAGALAAACAPTSGHPIRHDAGKWPAVVLEDHTDSVWPVWNGILDWKILNTVRGNCASFPERVCYRFLQGDPGNNGGYTSYTYYASGPQAGQTFQCTTTVATSARSKSLNTRRQLVGHEIGHCYGMAHAQQGGGIMSPVADGTQPVPTQDEKDTMASLYTG